jgi:carotenoid cleavage dioxygenase-like enzyme
VPRDGSGVRWIAADDNFYDLHPMNAFVDGDRVVLDAPEFPIAPVPMDGVDPWEQFRGLTSHLVRYELDLDACRMKRRPLDDRNMELPQCDRRRQGLGYRYGYGLCSAGDLDDYSYDAVIRYDLARGTQSVHRFADGDSLCEPIFVPRGADVDEGDGYLLLYIWHAAEDRSAAVVLDATALDDEPVATIALPHRVPFTAHGWWGEGIA